MNWQLPGVRHAYINLVEYILYIKMKWKINQFWSLLKVFSLQCPVSSLDKYNWSQRTYISRYWQKTVSKRIISTFHREQNVSLDKADFNPNLIMILFSESERERPHQTKTDKPVNQCENGNKLFKCTHLCMFNFYFRITLTLKWLCVY